MVLSLRRKRRVLMRRREALEDELDSLEEEVERSRSHKKRIKQKRRSLHSELREANVEIAAVLEALQLDDKSVYLRRMLVYHRLKWRKLELGILRERLLKPEYKSLKKRTIGALRDAERSIEGLLSNVDSKALEDLEHELDRLLEQQDHLDHILQVLEIRAERDFRRTQREASGDVYDYGMVVEGSFESGKKR